MREATNDHSKARAFLEQHANALLFLMALAAPAIVQIAYMLPLCVPKISPDAVLQYYGLFVGIAGTAWFAFSNSVKKTKAEMYAKAKADTYTEAIEQCRELRLNKRIFLDNNYLKDLKRLEAKIELYGSAYVRASYRRLLDYLRDTRIAYDNTMEHVDEQLYDPHFFLCNQNDPNSLRVDFRPNFDEEDAVKGKRIRELEKSLLPTSKDIREHLDELFEEMRNDYN